MNRHHIFLKNILLNTKNGQIQIQKISRSHTNMMTEQVTQQQGASIQIKK